MTNTAKLAKRQEGYETEDGYSVKQDASLPFAQRTQVWIVRHGDVEVGSAFGLKAARSLITRHRSAQ